VQDTTRLDVVEPERKSLGYAQSRGSDQPEQHDVELAAQGIGLLMPKIAGGIEDTGDLVCRVYIGDWPDLPARREVSARDLMPRIFGMEEARKQHQVRQAPLAGAWRLGDPCQPVKSGCRADMGFAPPGGEVCEGAKMSFGLDQLVSERAAQSDVTVASSLSMATSRPRAGRSPTGGLSTLAYSAVTDGERCRKTAPTPARLAPPRSIAVAAE